MNGQFLKECERIIGARHVETSSDPPVFSPSSEAALRELMRRISTEKYPVRMLGSGTCPSPEASGDTISLSTRNLARVKEVHPDDFLMVVQAGVVVDDAAAAAEESGLYLPLDITSGDRATIGGAYMTDAVGPGETGYGPFHETVLGVRCLTPIGDVVTFGGRTAKNVTGYDVTRFLAGTRGLFAIAVELILKVRVFPESRIMVVAHFLNHAGACRAVSRVLADFGEVKRFELVALDGLAGAVMVGVGFEGMDFFVRRESGRLAELLAADGAETVVCKNYNTFRKKRRKAAAKMAGLGLYIISVPRASVPSFLERISAISPDLPIIGHPQLGRFHVRCHDRDTIDRITTIALALGGKHPVAWYTTVRGLEQLFDRPTLAFARSLKGELDPAGVLNPHLGLR